MMGRVTRKKAAEIAEQLHIDEDALLDISGDDIAIIKAKAATPDPTDRAPLGELAPNSAESNSHSDESGQELKKSVRGKNGGKKGGVKGKKNNLAASIASRANEDPQDDVLPDDNDSAPSPASEKAAEDLMKDVPELCISQAVRDTRAKSPPSAAVKLTRSQLKEKKDKTEPEPKSLVDGLDQEQSMKEETVRDIPVIQTSESELVNGNSEATMHDAPASPLPNAVPNVVSNLRVEMTPAKRTASNKENIEPADMESPQLSAYDDLEDAAATAATPPRSERDSSVRPEDHISALDELDEAVETVSNDIPVVQTSPEKPKAKRDASKKPAPVVRTTKAAAARISLAHGPKDTASKPPALGRPSPSKALGRSSSTRLPASGSNRVFSSISAKDGSPNINGEKREVVIPHSKPRPISLSFPTPPPPPKSTKAPTQSTFKLPGEAVAEKLKAARDARMAKQAEDEKKKAFKARPVPSSLSKAPSVRHTNSSKARESLMNGKDVNRLSSAPVAAHQRANSVATSRPTAPKPRVPSTNTSKPPSTSSSRPPLYAPKKRPSTAMADMSKPRASLATSTGPSGLARIPSGQSKGTAKGKEVFNRAAAAKAAADKEKSEKEEATKRARAEAAERSKLAARAFAEKQKKKQLAAKQAAQKPQEPSAASTAVEAAPEAIEA